MTSIDGEVKVYSEIYGLKIESQRVEFLPRGLEKFLPNLTGIFIYTIEKH